MSIEFLRRLPLFAGLADQDLERLYAQAVQFDLPAGHLLIEEGTPGDALYVLLAGELEVTKRSGAANVKIDVRKPGDVIGEMSLLDNAARSASVQALGPSRVLCLSKDMFEQVLATSPSAAIAILHTVTARLRQNESLLREREKMAGLGTLAAGLAHELNNPAAAVRRAAGHLRELLADWQAATSALEALPLDAQQRAHVQALRASLAERAAEAEALDPLARSDREAEVERWLEERGVADAWDLAPDVVSCGWKPNDLAQMDQRYSASHLSALVRALALETAVAGLLDEIGKGADRISEIVKAVKTYSYLDRAPVQEVDVREGLDNTLVILRHKLKSGIRVQRDYAEGLPPIEAYAGELNQVWTNILDNAIDALQPQVEAGQPGEIRLRTLAEGDRVVVEIQDNGPGIPANIRPRVFEPFFTTKPPGVGTGLGLNIAYNVVNKHYGDIQVSSRPGETCFRVRLPQRLPPAS